MQSIDLVVSSKLERTARVKQLEGMFDVPAQEKLTQSWRGQIPIDERPWNIGLIVGPSGSGKSQIMRHLFGEPRTYEWGTGAVIDDFSKDRGIQEIADACSAVGFNTIPSWMKPHAVLSNGERFRVDLARHLLETPDPVVIDEFTSVVDRQVAQIASHAVAKRVRKMNRKFVAVSCHYDIVDWLQPDWVLEPATMAFHWREVQRRPEIKVEIARVDHSLWRVFAPFHYLNAELAHSAACYALLIDDRPVSFIAMMYRPHPKRDNIWGISRAVTLPDFQGLGLVMFLESIVCGAYRALGRDVHGYPAHPSHIRSLDRSKDWALLKKPGNFSPANRGASGSLRGVKQGQQTVFGGRPCAVFKFVGPAIDEDTARRLIYAKKDVT